MHKWTLSIIKVMSLAPSFGSFNADSVVTNNRVNLIKICSTVDFLVSRWCRVNEIRYEEQKVTCKPEAHGCVRDKVSDIKGPSGFCITFKLQAT